MGITRVVCTFAMILTVACPAWAQPILTGPAQMLPSSPLSMPAPVGGSSRQSLSINSGALSEYIPTIPNLDLGFQYFFGDRVRSNQANADYLLPYSLSPSSVIFGEAHGNWWNFTNKPVGGAGNRIDLSFGGGYRKILSNQLLCGINGFYDTSRLFDQWYSSGGVGLEMAANIGTSDAVDLNANWYGDIFSSSSIINAFRNHGGSYDIETGYSHALFNQALDLRLKFAGYQFDVGNSVYGYKTGADLTTKDGMFRLRYEYGSDRINGQWNNIGAFVNVGFQAENIIRGESPFTMPEPIFKSPRNLRRMLTQKVKRDWNQQYAPGRAALAAAAAVSGVVWVTPSPDYGNLGSLYSGTFDPVDKTLLDPDAYVMVSFTYTNSGATLPTHRPVLVKGSNTTDSVFGYVNFLSGGGTATVVLNAANLLLSHFRTAPTTVEVKGLSAKVDISNVRVGFTYR